MIIGECRGLEVDCREVEGHDGNGLIGA